MRLLPSSSIPTMSPTFRKCQVESYFDFLAASEGFPVVFCFVHDSSKPADSTELLSNLPVPADDELYLEFDLAEHSTAGKQFLLDLPSFETRWTGQVRVQAPFFRAFVFRMGFIDSAFEAGSAHTLVLRARMEREQMRAHGLL